MLQRSQIPKMPYADAFFDVRDIFQTPNILKCSQAEIDAIYTSKRNPKKFDEKLFLAWKVLRDPYYRTLVPRLKNFRELYDAGFFVDLLDVEDIGLTAFQPGECRTPIAAVAANIDRLPSLKKPVVLLCTGAFSPLHNGHVSMMEHARAALEKRGYQIVGGYFSPSHDAYVSEKYEGAASLLAAHRVYLGQLTVADSDWLRIDPWESRYLPTDVNFTDVVSRLETYLNFYLKSAVPIQVAYVFGDDNVGFSRAFLHKGLSICIGRILSDERAFTRIKTENPRSKIFYAPASSSAKTISSSSIRKWVSGLLPERTESLYFKWKKDLLSVYETERRPKKLYILRDDSTWSLKPWSSIVPMTELQQAKQVFLKDLEILIGEAFSRVAPPDIAQDVSVRIYSSDEQLAYVRRLKKTEVLLNLDVCTNEDAGVQFSRLFSLCDGQIKSNTLVARPGYPDVSKQIKAIKPGKYTLLDDDVASGSTMNMLLGMLPENARVTKIRTLLEYSRSVYLNQHLRADDLEAFDMVDLRDFIFGARAGGLVIRLPNGHIGRAPYSLPYLSLVTRAKIPPSSEMSFSHEIWKLNHLFFSHLSKDIRIRDTDPSFQRFCTYLGFGGEVSMKTFCEHHMRQLFSYL